MAESLFVNVRYRGLDLGQRLCIEDFAAGQAYLHHAAPMPVGSELVLEVAEDLEVPVRVSRVSEQVAGIEKPPGMFVVPGELSGAAQDWWASQSEAADVAKPEDEPAVVEAKGDEAVEATDTQVVEAAPAQEPEAEAAKPAEPEPEPEAKPVKAKKKRRRKKK